MRLAVLGSGSGGNATLLDTGKECVLVDAGLSAKQLVLRMTALGVDPGSLAGILLTHEHGDHVKGLEVFARKHEVPVYTTAITQEALRAKVTSVKEWKLFSAGQAFAIAGLQVQSFSIPHDAVDPVGFAFEGGGMRAGVLTDLGHVTERVKKLMAGVTALVLESNYCDQMLDADEKRPWSLKQRISSRHGHLSNIQAREFAAELQAQGLERVVLGHLSRDCNTATVAAKEFEKLSLKEVRVAAQDETTGWMRVAEPPPITFTVDERSGQVMMELFG